MRAPAAPPTPSGRPALRHAPSRPHQPPVTPCVCAASSGPPALRARARCRLTGVGRRSAWPTGTATGSSTTSSGGSPASTPTDQVRVIVTLRVPATAARVDDLADAVGGFETEGALLHPRRLRRPDDQGGRPSARRRRLGRARRARPSGARGEQHGAGLLRRHQGAARRGPRRRRRRLAGRLLQGRPRRRRRRHGDRRRPSGSGRGQGARLRQLPRLSRARSPLRSTRTATEPTSRATIAGEGDAHVRPALPGRRPAAALVGVRALDAAGNGFMSDVVSALGWIRANRAVYGIEVVNLSLGADGCGNGADATSVAVANAVADGLVVVVSAGNEGPGSCTVGSPAAAAAALTVGAMADTGEGGFKLAPFSSRGPTLDGRVKPDLVGPGVRITSAATGTSTGYATYSGTSMAAPFVAGVALLMLEANGSLTPAAVKAALLSTAVDWGAGGADPEFGSGRLDAYAALAAAGAPLTSPPAVPIHLLRDATVPLVGGAVDVPLTVTNPGFPVGVTVTTPDLELRPRALLQPPAPEPRREPGRVRHADRAPLGALGEPPRAPARTSSGSPRRTAARASRRTSPAASPRRRSRPSARRSPAPRRKARHSSAPTGPGPGRRLSRSRTPGAAATRSGARAPPSPAPRPRPICPRPATWARRSGSSSRRPTRPARLPRPRTRRPSWPSARIVPARSCGRS